jgi:hypothetical protein
VEDGIARSAIEPGVNDTLSHELTVVMSRGGAVALLSRATKVLADRISTPATHSGKMSEQELHKLLSKNS